MPELPEVETVRRQLTAALPGEKIASIKVLHPRAVRRNNGPSLRSKNNPLLGAEVTGINRRGKFLWLTFDSPFALVIHLGMSGQVLLPSAPASAPRHLRVRFEFVANEIEMHFVDQRTFGYLAIEELTSDRFHGDFPDGLIPLSVAHIAPDVQEILSGKTPTYSIAEVIERIREKKSEIKRVLLNQEVLSGVGNIYADEGLWSSTIHPEVLACDLSEDEVRALLLALGAVMDRATEAGGSSIDEQWKQVNGKSGYFNLELNAYGNAGEPCPRCGTLIQRLRFMNRSSHLCPKCQKKR